jgi:hypothetical protein
MAVMFLIAVVPVSVVVALPHHGPMETARDNP